MNDKPKKTNDDVAVNTQAIKTTIQSWIQWGNERALIVRDRDGKELLSLPMTAAAIVGGIGVFFALPLAIVLAVVAFFLRLRFEIVSFANDSDDTIVYPERLSQSDQD